MTTIIHPSQFASHESPTGRFGAWNPGTLERLVPLLAGRPVILEVQKGLCEKVEVLEFKHGTMYSQYAHLLTRSDFEDGTSQKTLRRVSDLGAIIEDGPYSTAPGHILSTALYEENYRAMKAVRALIGSDWPEQEPAAGRPRFQSFVRTHGRIEVVWGDDTFRAQRWTVEADGTVTTHR